MAPLAGRSSRKTVAPLPNAPVDPPLLVIEMIQLNGTLITALPPPRSLVFTAVKSTARVGVMVGVRVGLWVGVLLGVGVGV